MCGLSTFRCWYGNHHQERSCSIQSLSERSVGEGGTEKSRAADAPRWIRLCCFRLLEKRVREGEERNAGYDQVKWDQPSLPHVSHQVNGKKRHNFSSLEGKKHHALYSHLTDSFMHILFAFFCFSFKSCLYYM